MSDDDDHIEFWDDDEERVWGSLLPKPGSGWSHVATKVEGGVTWEPGWPSIEKAVRALSMLEELREYPSDWHSLLTGLRHLHVLEEEYIDWPPLNSFRDFMQIGDFFLTFESQNDLGAVELLYIMDDQPELTDPLLAEFDELTHRLKAYPPLQPYVRYM